MDANTVYDLPLVERLLVSHRGYTGRALAPLELSSADAARWLYDEADFAVLAHDAGNDPRFMYANLLELR